MALFALREKVNRKGELKGFDVANVASGGPVDGVLESLPAGEYKVVGTNQSLVNAEVTYVTKQVNHIG